VLLSLSEALRKPPAKNKIDAILDEVSIDEQAALRIALSKPAVWSHSALAKVLTDKVSPVSEAAVRRWRGAQGITE
jgi:hypothetical protein